MSIVTALTFWDDQTPMISISDEMSDIETIFDAAFVAAQHTLDELNNRLIASGGDPIQITLSIEPQLGFGPSVG
jgi:hypothetical protein